MKMDDPHTLAPQFTNGASPQVFRQLGTITRELHEALNQLGVTPGLQFAAANLPDARSRLNFIATKTHDAATRVLNSVDAAKADHTCISDETRRMGEAIVKDPVRAVASGAVMNFVAAVDAATTRIDGHLTDIMLAQDFHDLTGQVVARVVALVADLEASLVKLLVQAAPSELTRHIDAAELNGPVVNPEGRTDVVANQGEVDDLLASMGF